MMLSKLNIVDALSSSKDPTPAAEEGRSEKEIEKTRIAALQKRIKVLLKEAENKKCSECRSDKPKWMSLLQTPLDYNTQQLGVFCCNNCQPYHLALGEDLCTIKSLKNPEECKFTRNKRMYSTSNSYSFRLLIITYPPK